MTKIVPFAVAVILVLAVGFYLFTSKISKSPALLLTTGTVENQMTPGPKGPGGTAEGTKTTPTPNVNQIALTVTAPANNITVSTPSLTVRGVTKPGAEVSVNETDVVAGGGGNFSANITLEEGDNYIIVVAVDEDGGFAEEELDVTYTPAQ